MDYFNSAVKYDPVNYYILFTKEELMTIKHRLSLEEISKLKNDLKCLDIDYQAIKRSIVSKKDLLMLKEMIMFHLQPIIGPIQKLLMDFLTFLRMEWLIQKVRNMIRMI